MLAQQTSQFGVFPDYPSNLDEDKHVVVGGLFSIAEGKSFGGARKEGVGNNGCFVQDDC